MTWADTGLPWILPSPNLPTVEAAEVYVSTVFLEATTLSEGRGTTMPFEVTSLSNPSMVMCLYVADFWCTLGPILKPY